MQTIAAVALQALTIQVSLNLEGLITNVPPMLQYVFL